MVRKIWLVVLMLVWALPGAASADTKRGIAGGPADVANALNARWRYLWTSELPTDAAALNGELVPMIYSASLTNIHLRVDRIFEYAQTYNVQYVLGFNEPERADQANMSVQQALDVWQVMTDRFEGTGIKLVSPAVSADATGQQWIADFMAGVESRNNDADPANNLRVDEIAFHWYGNVSTTDPAASANTFLNRVDSFHSLYNRPVWITEFAGLDWSDTVASPDTINANAAFLEVAVPGLESRSHVARYAWWQYGQTNGEEDDSRLLLPGSHGVLAPTVIGDFYIPTLNQGEVADLNGQPRGKDYFYLRGAQLTNTGSALGNEAAAFIYALGNRDGSSVASTIGGTGNWGMTQGGVAVASNAALRKAGPNTIQIRDSAFFIDGQVRLMGTSGPDASASNSGNTLWIHGPGTTAVGTGFFRLDPGSTLRLGHSDDTAGFTLPYAMQLRGGKVTASGPGIELTGTLSVFNRTSLTVALGVDLTVNGTLAKPDAADGSGIDKDGNGKLVLNGTHTYLGSTRVNFGTLAGNGSAFNSDLIVAANGTVAPGLSIGTLAFAAAAIGGKLHIEIDGETIDLLDIVGDLDITATRLNLIELGPLTGDRLIFATYGGDLIGSFASVAGLPRGYTMDLSVRHQIALARQVPEPASLLLMGSWAAVLLGLRSRRG